MPIYVEENKLQEHTIDLYRDINKIDSLNIHECEHLNKISLQVIENKNDEINDCEKKVKKQRNRKIIWQGVSFGLLMLMIFTAG